MLRKNVVKILVEFSSDGKVEAKQFTFGRNFPSSLYKGACRYFSLTRMREYNNSLSIPLVVWNFPFDFSSSFLSILFSL